jgi:hypothetical protein
MAHQRGTSPSDPTATVSAAADLQFVALAEALELTLLLVDGDPERYERAAVRWHARFLYETRNCRTAGEPGCARPLGRNPGGSPGRYRPRRAPQPATHVRANLRGACPLVASREGL